MAKYRNTFYRAHDTATYGPEFFEVDAKPVEHLGMLIYRRQPNCFDIVVNDECVGMYAGLNGAKRAITERFGRASTLRELAD